MDVIPSTLCAIPALPLAFAIVIVSVPSLRKRAFARFYNDTFGPYLVKHLHEHKAKLFAGTISLTEGYNLPDDLKSTDLALASVVSADPALRVKGQVRLLEMGPGPGTHLRYYPENVVFVGVDPNAAMVEHFKANRARLFPHVQLEKIVAKGGEEVREHKAMMSP
jgi:hypothetical protein